MQKSAKISNGSSYVSDSRVCLTTSDVGRNTSRWRLAPIPAVLLQAPRRSSLWVASWTNTSRCRGPSASLRSLVVRDLDPRWSNLDPLPSMTLPTLTLEALPRRGRITSDSDDSTLQELRVEWPPPASAWNWRWFALPQLTAGTCTHVEYVTALIFGRTLKSGLGYTILLLSVPHV